MEAELDQAADLITRGDLETDLAVITQGEQLRRLVRMAAAAEPGVGKKKPLTCANR
ncbi:hypothetical protein OIE68_30920 [Nocardia vinacea]|uniref:hypothetical protein n=1 Tax=Nocardia vinacea TaxID=96468 RepID=UPI002E150F97|nr:hypothetical protein OIE68_30920 [Nocardia vinacea]